MLPEITLKARIVTQAVAGLTIFQKLTWWDIVHSCGHRHAAWPRFLIVIKRKVYAAQIHFSVTPMRCYWTTASVSYALL